jgi:serine protease Do
MFATTRGARRSALVAVTAALAAVALAAPGCHRQAGSPRPPAAEGTPAFGTPAAPVTPRTEAPNEARVMSSAFAAVARAMRPSVVRIDVEVKATRVAENEGAGDEDLAPFLRRFFPVEPDEPERAPGPLRGTGSGVVIDGQGDIVTNRHVVTNATRVNVTFSDGREFAAKTLGMDAETDVAVIRLDKPPADLVAARLGDSEKLEVGEWVLAVGSPLGLDQTVTAGIVSGKGKVGRHVQMSGGRVRHYIQTDAKINPGNSGGPLVNLSSEVVGINTLINTGPGGAYGFAIPINQVTRVAGALLKEGRVRYAYLGVLVGDLDDGQGGDGKPGDGKPGDGKPGGAASGGKGLPGQKGAYVSQVTPGGPAAKAGLRAGDVIGSIDGHKMDGAGDVIDYVSTRPIGTRVAVGFAREGHGQTVTVALGELPSEEQRATAGAAGFGMALQTLTPRLGESMGIPPATRGAVVAEVVPGSPAAAVGIQAGDVLLEIDRQRVGTAEDANAALAAPRRGGHLVRVAGANGTRFVNLGGN